MRFVRTHEEFPPRNTLVQGENVVAIIGLGDDGLVSLVFGVLQDHVSSGLALWVGEG